MKDEIRIGTLTILEVDRLFNAGNGLRSVADEAGVSIGKLYADLRKHGYRYCRFGRLEPIQARPLKKQAA